MNCPYILNNPCHFTTMFVVIDNKGKNFPTNVELCYMWKCSLLIALMSWKGLFVPAEVLALRPFVTTDADVVETNLVEIELGIFGLHDTKASRSR